MKRQPTIVDVTWLLDLSTSGKLDLDPPYQRKSVWTLKDKRFFLDSIFRDFPCPPIFLHKSLDENGSSTYHVVDGKQRLQAIIGFTKNEFSLAKDFGDDNLDGKSWKDIPSEYKKKLWNYVLSIEYMDDVSDSTTINEIFDRVNRNQKKLERQELRHAKYSGWFSMEAENEADKDIWKKFSISTTTKARRMRDVQFVSELMLVVLENSIRGFDQDVLDSKYAEYDDPESGAFDFDKTAYESEMTRIKDILEAIEQENNAVTKHAKSVTNFYTLWSLIALHTTEIDDDVQSLAQRYSTFMDDVKQASADDQSPSNANVAAYLNNSLGASTDLKQRRERLKALEAATLL